MHPKGARSRPQTYWQKNRKIFRQLTERGGDMNALLKELLQMPEARALLDSTLRRDKPMVTGISPVHRAMLAAAMLQETGRPMLLLCGDETEAARLCGDLHALTGRDVTLLRRRDWQLRPSAAATDLPSEVLPTPGGP